MKKIETYLPVFTGFYNTIFEPSEEDELNHINEEREKRDMEPISWDDCDWKYDEYYKDTAKYCCDWVEHEMNSLGIPCTITFQKVVSPRFYNFTNDSINCEVQVDVAKLIDYATDNWEEFTQYIKDRYTSCDGFTSFHSNDPAKWLNELPEKEAHNIGSLMHFILLNENYDAKNEMFDYGQGNISGPYAENYEELTT